MKGFIVFGAIVALVAASDVPIIRNDQSVSFDGSFKFIYETGDGISAQAVGDGNSVTGSYSYTAPDGTAVQTTYVADENGYQPTGSHVPAIPEAIARAIEYIKAHPPQGAEQGAYIPD